ncbi:MAG: hypothetical protein CMD29_05135 [Flavobacteriales bacterium]|nr:hypothetical protein [Flavobacteriales bacterium]
MILIIGYNSVSAQDQVESKWEDKISFSGYLRYMNSSSVINSDSTITDNLIHNRLRIKLNFNSRFDLVVEMRNRAFFGQATKTNPNLGNILNNDLGEFDLSFVPYNQKELVIHSIFDRAYINYSSDNWELRIGRQRINWGVNLAWNPNDLFNAYSLIDFDYQERLGVDALRFQYYTGEMSSIELSAQPGYSLDESIFAGLWKFNLNGSDFQFLFGNYYEDIALGFGLATNIKNAGVAIESTYFNPKANSKTSREALSTSFSIDYSTKSGIYFNSSFLFNSQGSTKKSTNNNLFGSFLTDISAKRLMPSKLTYFTQVSGNFTPAINASMTVFYMKGEEMILIMPSITYELKENLDTMLLTQLIYNQIDSNFNSMGAGIFLRFAYNF